jgi:predicted phage terminase large subunit-like protein
MAIDLNDPNQFMYAKAKCLIDTLFFTRLFFKELYGKKFVIGEHHRIIAKKMDDVFEGRSTRVIFNIAPRYGKTELCVKMGIAKGLALNAGSKFIHLSYSDKLALDNSEFVKEVVNLPLYKKMFPEVQIKKGTDAKEKWYTTESGGVYAAAAGGQITGFGAGVVESAEQESEEFGGAIIIDDPIKPEDAQYENKRNAVNDRYDSTIVNRVNSRKTPIIIIMQRVHEMDLCGHVMKNYKDFEVVSMPVINKDGSALWPHKHTIEELYKLREANKFVFDTQMMQDPTPKDGVIFDADKLNYFRPSKDLTAQFETSMAYTDVADQGEDDLSLPIGRNIKDRVYIVDWVHMKAVLNGEEIGKEVVSQKLKEHKVVYNRVESNAMGASFGRSLQRMAPNCAVMLINNNQNKHTRILMAEGFIKKHFWFIHPDEQPAQYKEAMNELCKYARKGTTKKDDSPDALSGLKVMVESFLSNLYQ